MAFILTKNASSHFFLGWVEDGIFLQMQLTENDGEGYLQGFPEGRVSSLTTLMLSPSLVVIPFSAPGNQAKKIILEVHPCGTELPA